MKPVVADSSRLGPCKAVLVPISSPNGPYNRAIVFNGIVFKPKNKTENALLLFLPEDGGFGLSRADVNLDGQICGMSILDNSIIISINRKSGDDKGWETVLYEFPGTRAEGPIETENTGNP